jgi:hypothetical protein
VGLGRFELPTSRLSSARSNQLSYRPFRRRRIKCIPTPKKARVHPCEERETKAAGSRFSSKATAIPAVARYSNESEKASRARKHTGCYSLILRKEVIQPQVPLRLPCYDFTPVADLTVAGCLLAVSAPSSGKTNSHGVTGGVYKARERIHRAMLMRDY